MTKFGNIEMQDVNKAVLTNTRAEVGTDAKAVRSFGAEHDTSHDIVVLEIEVPEADEFFVNRNTKVFSIAMNHQTAAELRNKLDDFVSEFIDPYLPEY